jgi:hypothetical protein
MTRLILSILSGFIFTAVLSTAVDHIFHVTEIYPPYGAPMRDHGLLLLAFTYRAIFSISGAYITAAIAREQAMKAVLIMGVIGSLLWLAGAIAMWEFAYPWYNILGVITGVPFSILGAKLYQRRVKSGFVNQ